MTRLLKYLVDQIRKVWTIQKTAAVSRLRKEIESGGLPDLRKHFAESSQPTRRSNRIYCRQAENVSSKNVFHRTTRNIFGENKLISTGPDGNRNRLLFSNQPTRQNRFSPKSICIHLESTNLLRNRNETSLGRNSFTKTIEVNALRRKGQSGSVNALKRYHVRVTDGQVSCFATSKTSRPDQQQETVAFQLMRKSSNSSFVYAG